MRILHLIGNYYWTQGFNNIPHKDGGVMTCRLKSYDIILTAQTFLFCLILTLSSCAIISEGEIKKVKIKHDKIYIQKSYKF